MKTLLAGHCVTLIFSAALMIPCAVFAADVADGLRIGWATTDMTPEGRVAMAGGSRARIASGVMDPITATALVLESIRDGERAERIVMVSMDLGSVRENVRDRVFEKVSERIPEFDLSKLVLNGTHTHAMPEARTAPDLVEKFHDLGVEVPLEWSWWGIDLDAKSPLECAEFMAEKIAETIQRALENREPGGVSFGLGHAVVGHNRLTAYYDGTSKMYGDTNTPEFSHVEGYEDHSVGLLYTFDADGELTGVVVNIACPAQVSEGGTLISADFWHETREELRYRLGESLHVLPQIAAAGDQSPHILVDHRAEERMQEIMFPHVKSGRRSLGRRKQIAVRIADAVTSVLPYMEQHIDWDPVLAHRTEMVELTRRRLPDAQAAQENFERLFPKYVSLRQEIEEDPDIRQKNRWSDEISNTYWHLARALRTIERYELQQREPTLSVPVHVVRLGDLAIATNPFELYVDYGAQIKARSRAVQTFTVQLSAAYHQYLPTKRSVAGGAYGAIPESNQAGPEGGRELVERTLELIESLWTEQHADAG